MSYCLDERIERRGTDSRKWCEYPEDVLPFTGAELEFASPAPVIAALRERINHPMFGYNIEPHELRRAVVAELQGKFNWKVSPESLVFLPGVVVGLNMACRAFAAAGDAVLVQPPVYPGILDAPIKAGLHRIDAQLVQGDNGQYTIDFRALGAMITSRTRLLILCNPHNPVGRVFRREELEALADICLRHDLIVCADEIYANWVYDGGRHVPIASLSPEIAARTVTLIGTSKSHNIPGIKVAVAVIENPDLRVRFEAMGSGIVPTVGILEYAAALAAYRDGQSWVDSVSAYLHESRDLLVEYAADYLPGVRVIKPEGTPVVWLDCRELDKLGNPAEFFLREAKVALNDGASYGPGGDGFVRLAFGCPHSMLQEGLQRMSKALYNSNLLGGKIT